MKLDDALSGVTRLGFDTSPLIYFVEANPRYDAVVTEIFKRVSSGLLLGLTSVITLCEVLTQPILQQQTHLQQEYRDFLLNSLNLDTPPITPSIAEQAAKLRAGYRLRTPDALQIAVALEARCEAFLCNDLELRRVAELRVLILDELEL